MSRLALSFYSAVMRMAQPLLRQKLARRALQEPGYADAVNERFGHYTQPKEAAPELVWLHAVSLGETRAAAVLLEALRITFPGLRLLLTHGTATGRAEGKALLRAGDVQVWQPWDTRDVVERFFEHFKPRLGVLIETEVWPCAVAAAQARKIPLVVCNGRLSDKSLQQALTLSPLAMPAYAALTAVYAQTEPDAQRYRRLGVSNVFVFGNLKFDATPSLSQQQLGQLWRSGASHQVIVLASSREGEEALFISEITSVAQQIRAQNAPENVAVKWLIVPRHPQRFDEVAALCVENGLTVSRRSTWAASPFKNVDALHADVWLGDSLGEMALYYALSSAALLGGSFAPLGGQNLIEAAASACPVVMGPHTFNFAEAAELSAASGAGFTAPDMRSAIALALELAGNPLKQASASLAATAFAARYQGAAKRNADALAVYLQLKSA